MHLRGIKGGKGEKEAQSRGVSGHFCRGEPGKSCRVCSWSVYGPRTVGLVGHYANALWYYGAF